MDKPSTNQLPDALGEDIKEKIISAIEKLNAEDYPGVIQVSEDYGIKVEDENWIDGTPLIRCPSWYASIVKAVPFSGLFFMATHPEIDPSEDYLDEHIFLDLPGWKQVAEDYPFFVEMMHTSKHYPIASSGYGYLVIGKDSTPDDPIFRWDGSGMTCDQAFSHFSDLLDSAKPFE